MVTCRKQHVLFVLVDSSGIRNRVSVFDDRHRLPLRKENSTVIGDNCRCAEMILFLHSQSKRVESTITDNIT